MKITFIELPATIDGRLNSRPSKDVYSLVSLPSRAIDLLTAIVREAGYNDVVAMNPAFNGKSAKLSSSNWNRLMSSDIVGISTITRTAPQSYELADQIKSANPKVKILIGGPHISAMPAEALEHADIAIQYEGDKTILDLIKRLEEDILNPDLSDIKGIAYKDQSAEIKINEKREFLTPEELNALPFPTYSKDTLKSITHTVINTSRGCPYNCEYCSVVENFGRKFRYLDIERTVELIQHTLAQTKKRIFFGDDSFAADTLRVKKLLARILEKEIKMPPWLAQVRVESANDTELLDLMKRSGCERVCIGFESIDDNILSAFNKKSSLEKNTHAIRMYHKYGISIHGMFIFGSDLDTPQTIQKTVEYIKSERIDTVQYMSLVPLPGTRLTKRYEAEGKIISKEWHRYDGHHVLTKPEKMGVEELQEEMEKAWLSSYTFKEGIKHLFTGNEHLFNFLVRTFGRRTVRRAIRDAKSYKLALSSLDQWQRQLRAEYSDWSKRADGVINEIRSGLSNRQAQVVKSFEDAYKKVQVVKSLEDAYKKIQEQKVYINDVFSPYVQKVHQETIQKMQAKLDELKLLWNSVSLQPLPA